MAEINGGALTTKERLEKIDSSLFRIEEKLDDKVSSHLLDVTISKLDTRVTTLEEGTSPYARLVFGQFESLTKTVEDLVRHGSENARKASLDILNLQQEVTNLRTEREQRIAVVEAVNKVRLFRHQVLTSAAAVAAIISVALLILQTVH